MRVKIDARPMESGNAVGEEFFAIRLYPETNEEMRDLQWGLEVFDGPESFKLIVDGASVHYAVNFKRKDR